MIEVAVKIAVRRLIFARKPFNSALLLPDSHSPASSIKLLARAVKLSAVVAWDAGSITRHSRLSAKATFQGTAQRIPRLPGQVRSPPSLTLTKHRAHSHTNPANGWIVLALCQPSDTFRILHNFISLATRVVQRSLTPATCNNIVTAVSAATLSPIFPLVNPAVNLDAHV